MLGVRAIWVVSLFPENSRKIIYFRKFLTVERKIRLERGNNYVDLPLEEEFLRSLSSHLGMASGSNEFSNGRDSVAKSLCLPIISMKVKEKELWPILLMEQNSQLFCCLAGVKKKTSKHIIYSSTISMGFSLLVGLSQFFGPGSKNDKLSEKIVELDHFLSINMPFGSLFTCELQNAPMKKQTGWKPLSSKPTLSITTETIECVRSYQHGNLGDRAALELSGSVTTKLDSFSSSNEISLSFEQAGLHKGPYVDSFFIHPSVHTFTRRGDDFLKRIWFSPLQNDLTLCFYTANVPTSEIPISGSYKIKGNTLVELSIQLKLNENSKNSFSFCEVLIPFFNRGPIQSFEFKSSQGYLYASDDKYSLKWNIGGKFLSMDAFLMAKLDLAASPFPEYNDQFCCDKNSYIQVNFRQSDNVSGHSVLGPKSGTITTTNKAKINKGISQHSGEYRIWNTFGELPFPVVDQDEWPKEQFSIE